MADADRQAILLTGGTGFLGKSLLRHWRAEAQGGRPVPQLTVLSRHSRDFLARHPEFDGLPWLSFMSGDVLDPTSLPWDRAFTHVLHAAADSAIGPRMNPIEAYRQIADGTRNMLDFAVRTGVRRFLFVSSGAVYGRQPPELEALPEDWAGSPDLNDPGSAYGLAKRAGEHFCALYRHQLGLDTIIARCFAFVGPDLPLDVHFAIGNFIRDALWGDAITIEGDGTPVRSYMHQSDLASWLSAMLMTAKSGSTYNVGSPQAITIGDLAREICDSLAPHKPIRMLGRANHASQASRYVPDVSRICAELGVAVSIPLRDAILRTADLLRRTRTP